MSAEKRIRISAKKLARFAKHVRIRDQDGEGLVPFTLNREQVRVAEAAERHPWVYVLKARQVGLTTLWLFFDVLWCWVHDAVGKPVRCILLWDSEPNVKGKVRLCAWFCRELGIPHTPFSLKIEFPNGSEIVGLTAGGRTPGRSLDGADRVHASEMPYWRDGAETWQGVMALVSEDKSVTIETTMDVREPLARSLWDRPNNFHKMFLPVSAHTSYRAPERVPLLTAEDKVLLSEEGFNIEDDDQLSAGAWWLNKLHTDCDGDWHLLKKDYPQKPEHCFAVAEGRWVKSGAVVTSPLQRVPVEGMDGDRWVLEIYRHPEDVKGFCVISVDTATGAGLDSSVVLVYDSHDGAICAHFASDRVLYHDLARVAKEAHARYSMGPGVLKERPDRFRTPRVVVETNGVGKNTSRAMDQAGLPHDSWDTKREEKYRCMRAARLAIERKKAQGPEALSIEAGGCYYERGDFRGPKDTLMAYGIASIYSERELGIGIDETLAYNDSYSPRRRKRRPRHGRPRIL